MASWDTPVVNAPTTANYAPPVQDFSGISNLLQDFVKGREAGRTEDKARLFRNGIPRVGGGETGPVDFDKTLNSAAKVGGLDYAMPLLTLQNSASQGAAAGDAAARADAIANGRTSQPSSQPASAPAQPRPVAPQNAAPQAAPTTVMTILAAQGIPNNQLQAASESIARQLGVGITDPIDPKDPQVRNVLGPAIGFLKKNGIGEVVQPQPTAEPQAEPAATPAQRVSQGFETATPNLASQNAKLQAQADRYGMAEQAVSQQAIAAAASGNKALETDLRAKAGYYHDLQKGVLDQIAKANEPTGNRKDYEYAVAHGFKGTPDEWAAEGKSNEAGAQERAKADVKEQQEYIAAGKQAGSRLTTLNTIGNIVNSDKNLTLGFGGDTALKIKMALQQLGVPVGDLSGAEGIQKMNASLASEMAKSLSGRPTQFEFKSFMANNPGLLLDKAGNQRLIGIYSQLAQREYELGKLARQNTDNWGKWDTVVEKYDAAHPIIDPISKQPISTNSVIAPGPKKDMAPQEGAYAFNPTTKERLKLQDGKWVPFT